MAESAKVRLVRCPKCKRGLVEPSDISLYQCGDCGAVLIAKKKEILEEGLPKVSDDDVKGSGIYAQVIDIIDPSEVEMGSSDGTDDVIRDFRVGAEDMEAITDSSSNRKGKGKPVDSTSTKPNDSENMEDLEEAYRSIELSDLEIKTIIMAEESGDNRSIEFSDLEIKAIIMAEESGNKLYDVVDKITGETYSMKEFNHHYNASDRAKIIHEIEMIKKLDHPNLIKCLEWLEISDKIYILLERINCESLTGNVNSESALSTVAHSVLSCLSYLHRNKVSHGDIKPLNLFLSSKLQVKVLYLGKFLSWSLVVREIGGIHDEFSWDVWNVGLSILKLYKCLSYPSGKPVQKPSKELVAFLVCCMQTDLLKRWTAEELIYHPFVTRKGLRIRSKTSYPLLPEQSDSSSKMLSERSALEEQSIALSNMYEMSAMHQSPVLVGDDVEVSSPKFAIDVFGGDFWSHLVDEGTPFGGEEQISPKGGKFDNYFVHKDKSNVGEEVRKKFRRCVHSIGVISFLMKRTNYAKHSIDVPSVHFGHHSSSNYRERCIQHCSLLPPDYEFEKAKLVQLWIAEECMEEEGTKKMEDVADLYFDGLVHEEVIIPSKFDNFYRHLKYKVSTSKPSNLFVKQGDYLRINESNLDEICGEAIHLTWQCRLDQTLFDALKNLKQLHTLLVHGDFGTSIKQLPNDIFLGLKLLKSLDLSDIHISELPSSIGTVKSLRFLDISETPIKKLPESTDRLFFLQTLRLKGCSRFSALPRGIARLINLRHLDLDIAGQLKSMPRGMGNLTKLQTLQAFLVGKNDGCRIGELKNMNDITDSFCISGLENVANVEEAKEAALADKRYLDKLELRWRDLESDHSQDTTEILECLQPHFCLKELQITFFSGSRLPSWISNPSFIDLASITLYKCINCLILPCIGELLALKILHIVEMKNVTDINTIFCRSEATPGFSAFPKLEKLTIDNMLSLEEWTGLEDGDFPYLGHISLRYCPKLRVLPSLSDLCSLQHLEVICCLQLMSLPEGLLPSSLEFLIIRECPKLNVRCLEDDGEDRCKIAHVKNIWMDFQKISLD